MCRVLEVSKSGYYKWRRSGKLTLRRGDIFLLVKIKEIFEQSRKTYGIRRVCAKIRKEGIRVNRKRVRRLMQIAGIRAKMRRKFKITTNSKHKLSVVRNMIKEIKEIAEVNKVWVGDITYIWTKEGWLYLASIMDLYSRKIIGWCMSARLDKELVIIALRMAIETRKIEIGLIFHSDKGSQYCSNEFKMILKTYGIIQSMSDKGKCYDNAFKESFFHTLKTELVYYEVYNTREEAESSIRNYIAIFYNYQRLHSSLNYMSPIEFEIAYNKKLC
jgi:putative transposase